MTNKSYQINRDGKSLSPVREIRQVFNDCVGKLLPNRLNPDISEQRNQDQRSNNHGVVNSDAVFLGWQETSSGEDFPLYNVTAENHPLYHSTVSVQTLREQNLIIPQTPLSQSNEKRLDDEK